MYQKNTSVSYSSYRNVDVVWSIFVGLYNFRGTTLDTILEREKLLIAKLRGEVNKEDPYSYLIAEGRKLQQQTKRSSYYRWQHCQADVFLWYETRKYNFYIEGYSSSVIVSGVMKQMLYLYNRCNKAHACGFKPEWFDTLSPYFTTTRSEGIASLEKYIIKLSRR